MASIESSDFPTADAGESLHPGSESSEVGNDGVMAIGGDRENSIERSRSRARRWVSVPVAILSWLFGLASLLVGLALMATIPVLQLLSLGYLLEAGGRVARSGRLRDGLIGFSQARRLGSIVAGTWISFLPVRFISSMWYSAQLVDPTSDKTLNWRIALCVVTVVVALHVVWAWNRGGRLRHFLWPAPVRFVRWMGGRGQYSAARDALWQFVGSLHLPYLFWLGWRGFLGAMIWLTVPILLFIGATTLEAGPAMISGLLGSLTLGLVVLHLPFLQLRFAASGNWKDLFRWRNVVRGFFRAPLAAWAALFLTLLFALPLYLLKIELTPREVALLPSLVFVVFMLPARLITGWAVYRCSRPRTDRWKWLRRGLCGTSMLAAIPVIGFYLVAVFLTRYTSWYGVWSMFEQHAFLVPVPFLGM